MSKHKKTNKKGKTIRVQYFDKTMKKEFPLQSIEKGDWIDLRASERIAMKAGEFRLIPLGVAMQLPEGYEAWVAPRSSTCKQYGVIMANSLGIVDNSFCGPNDQWHFPALAIRDTFIEPYDRICQFRIMKNQPKLTFEATEQLDNPNRGGYGSTGVK